MNTLCHTPRLFCLFAAGALLGSPTLRADQTLETLVTFSGDNGSNPESIVQGPHGNFYGTTYNGGTGGKGTLFEVPLNSPIKTLVSFNGANGANPESHLVEWTDGNLYGTTYSGGAYDKGTVFQLAPGGGFRTVVSFNGANGASPISGLLMGSDGALYGTTSNGGAYGKGTLFKITAGGMSTMASTGAPGGAVSTVASTPATGGVATLGSTAPVGAPVRMVSGNGSIMSALSDPKDMTPVYGSTGDMDSSPADPPAAPRGGGGTMQTIVSFNGPNGANPQGLIRGTNGDFYGTTSGGGTSNDGTIFELTPAGHLSTLLDFTGPNGANPHSRLGQLEDGNFYGTTYNGGVNNLGTVFTYSPKDHQLNTLVSFNGANGSHPDSTLVPWSNGFFYLESLYQNLHIKTSQVQWSGVNFCGTTSTGGAHDNGTVFQVTDTGALVTLISFSGTNGSELGTIPNSIVPGNDGNLYGTTYYGGPGNHGTVYRVSLQVFPPPGEAANSVTAGGNVPANSLP